MKRAVRILLILTGGTITMESQGEQALTLVQNQREMDRNIQAILQRLPSGIQVDLTSVCNLDSTNLEITHWEQIARTIVRYRESYDGFVVAHGTDTMSFTAAALAFLLPGLDRPVVLTGAQLPLAHVYTDGTNNLINAFLLIQEGRVREVAIVFGSSVIRGTRARKVSAFDLQAFSSINSSLLAKIGLHFKYNEERLHARKGDVVSELCECAIEGQFCTDVLLVPVLPWMSAAQLEAMVAPAKGVVLQGFGAGNVPSRFLELMAQTIGHGVPVVVTTQCLIGKIELELYQVGKEFADLGIISARDMTPECALIKLMWLLGQGHDLEAIRKLFGQDLVGELS